MANTKKNSKHLSGAPKQLKRAGLYKGFLFVGGVLLTAGLFMYTNTLIDQVKETAISYLNRSVETYRKLLLEGNPELALQVVEGIDFPIVLTDSEWTPKAWRNMGIEQDDTSPEAIEKLREFIADSERQGNKPLAVEILPGQTDYFHYGDPELVRLLRIMSISTALIVAIYILVGYIGFRSIRKAEETSVWVGMARETAHQLGTPISSLMGWVEVLGEKGGDITVAMKQDIARLEKIAIRFSKIGAREELKAIPVSDIVEQAKIYMQTRVGKKVVISYEELEEAKALVQAELIGWVLENLIRNAAQAMSGIGKIEIKSGLEGEDVFIDIKDQGIGISQMDQETIFRPGYTTKKRGWGLGLSLARRIVEETHKGRIFVKTSKPGEGTTIRLVLPK